MPDDHWKDGVRPDLSSPEKIHEFALSVEQAGQEAVAEAIADHKAAGNPIYFRDPGSPDVLIKEMPDGRRFHVEMAEDGTEIVRTALPCA